jgi:hypothetical protein
VREAVPDARHARCNRQTDSLKRVKSTGWLYTRGENSHPLGKTDWLTMLKNKLLRNLDLGEEVTWGRRKWHNWELHNLQSSPLTDIIRVATSTTIKFVGYVACIGEIDMFPKTASWNKNLVHGQKKYITRKFTSSLGNIFRNGAN